MITAIVRFNLPETMTLAEAEKIFRGSAPKYEGLTGLVRKYYIFDEVSHTGGGVYLWESREAAQDAYSADWLQTVTERYGAPPEVTLFECPVIVENGRSSKAQAAE
ncbi:MAG: monooxygenase [Hyphomicrobiaceae bacterium]